MSYKKLFLLNIFLLLLLGIFANTQNFIFLTIKLLYIFIFPAALLLCLFKKEEISLCEFLFKGFALNLSYLIVLTILIKIFWEPLTFEKLNALNILFSSFILILSRTMSPGRIRISRKDLRITILSGLFIASIAYLFNHYLILSLEDMGFKIYRNQLYFSEEKRFIPTEYIFGNKWDENRKVYFLREKEIGKIYFKNIPKENEFIEINLAVKNNLGNKIRLQWNRELPGVFVIPFEQMQAFSSDYIRYAGKSVIFFQLVLRNEEENILEINSLKGDIYCEVVRLGKDTSSHFVYFPRMFDLMEVFRNSELFLMGNSYLAHQPPLNYYLGSIAFLFFGNFFQSLSFLFLGKLFFIFILMLLLIEDKKFLLPVNILCLSMLILYLKDYIPSSTYTLGDTLYTLNFLLFLYFLLKKHYFWSGLCLFFTSITRFPGYFLGLSFFLFYPVFFKKRFTKNKNLFKKILIFSFLGMLVFNVLYPALLHGFSNWMRALYFENIGEEHYGKDYVFAFKHFFSFSSKIVRYTFFSVFLVLFRRGRIIPFLIVSIIPYVLLIGSVQYHHIHYMFPIVCVGIISGIRSIQKILNL